MIRRHGDGTRGVPRKLVRGLLSQKAKYRLHALPVGPHDAVAKVSRIGRL